VGYSRDGFDTQLEQFHLELPTEQEAQFLVVPDWDAVTTKVGKLTLQRIGAYNTIPVRSDQLTLPATPSRGQSGADPGQLLMTRGIGEQRPLRLDQGTGAPHLRPLTFQCEYFITSAHRT